MTKMVKIFLSVLLSLSAATTPLMVSAQPAYIHSESTENEVISEDMYFSERKGKDNELILTAYNGRNTDLIVPEKVNGKTVTAIDDKVFSGNQVIEAVKLPDTINYFGADVFRDSSLRSINIPKSLRVIPSYSFNNCQELESVLFHDDIAIMANTAFKKTEIVVPDILRERVTGNKITSSDTSCRFSNTDWAYEVICSDGNVHVEIDFYKGESSDIIIPSELNGAEVKGLGIGTFSDRLKIRKIEFPITMTSLNVYFPVSELEEIILPCITEISISQFEDCTKLRKVTFQGDSSSINIGSKAFRNCTSLENISFPESCGYLNIEESAFENTGLKHLFISCPADIGNTAFSKCGSLLTAELADSYVSARAFMDCTSLTEMTFHGNTVLEDLSVYCCDSLENINFVDCQLTSRNAFSNCPKLNTINSETVLNSVTGDFIPAYKDFIFTHFNGSDNVGFINNYVIAQADRIVKENTNDSMTDIEKVLVLHDWVCRNTKYTDGNIGDRENHNDASVFMNEYTVCEGYARACNLLYHAAGIETYYVHSSDHAWNIVNVEGQYFHADATWDDTEPISRQWFLKSDAEFRKEGGSHSEWSLYTPSPLHDFQGDILPECKYSMGDVNADGEINVADLVAMQNYLLGRSNLEADKWILSDVCHDGELNVFDLAILKRIVIAVNIIN